MIAILITAPGEQYRIAHRRTEAPSDHTLCGEPVTSDWQGLPAELMTPICPDCDQEEPPKPPTRTPTTAVSASVGSSAHPTTPPLPETPQRPVQPAARTRETVRGSSLHASMWRLLAQLLNRT